MTEILYKIPTVSFFRDDKNYEMYVEFMGFLESLPLISCSLEFPDGKLFTKRDLTNAADYGII